MQWRKLTVLFLGLLAACSGCCGKFRACAPACPPACPPPGVTAPVVPAPANFTPASPSYGPRYYQPPATGQQFYQPPTSTLPPAAPRDPVANNAWRPSPGSAWQSESQKRGYPPPSTRLLPPSDDPSNRVMPPPADEPTERGTQQPTLSPDDESPDIKPYLKVTDRVYAGGQPFPDGWLWLKDRGFQTVLNLRPAGEDDTATRANVASAGLKYLSLEVSPETLNRALVERFASIVNDRQNQPIFVFDRRGMIAGTMWLLHYKLIEKAPDAQERAVRLGLKEDTAGEFADWWVAINRLLKSP